MLDQARWKLRELIRDAPAAGVKVAHGLCRCARMAKQVVQEATKTDEAQLEHMKAADR